MRPSVLALALALSTSAAAQVPLPAKIDATHPYTPILLEADANQDDLVTQEEIDAYVASEPVRAQGRGQAIWRSQMAFLGLTVVSTPTQEQVADGFAVLFARMDADKDGEVSSAETQAFAERYDATGRVALKGLLTVVGAERSGLVTREQRAALEARRNSPDPIITTQDAFVAKHVESSKALVDEVRRFWAGVGGKADVPLSLKH